MAHFDVLSAGLGGRIGTRGGGIASIIAIAITAVVGVVLYYKFEFGRVVPHDRGSLITASAFGRSIISVIARISCRCCC